MNSHLISCISVHQPVLTVLFESKADNVSLRIAGVKELPEQNWFCPAKPIQNLLPVGFLENPFTKLAPD
jgi:hypothetical protein